LGQKVKTGTLVDESARLAGNETREKEAFKELPTKPEENRARSAREKPGVSRYKSTGRGSNKRHGMEKEA